jgi:hypothetical protein
LTHSIAVLDSTLRDLSNATRELRTSLNRVIDDATRAVVALESGNRVAGSGLGYGPLGTQAPFEIATLSAKVDVLLNQAMAQGATAEQITTAYEVV